LSFALVAQDGRELYLSVDPTVLPAWDISEWVAANVVPIIDVHGAEAKRWVSKLHIQAELVDFFKGDPKPHIIADWPTDFQHLLPMLHDDMGHMIDMPSFTCSVERVDAYPTELKGAVQHNALWDARALRHRLEERT
jgi:hypothetical protein